MHFQCFWDLFVVRGRLEGAVVVVVQLGAGLVLHLLQAVNAAARTASAHGGAGDGVITAQTVHLTACLISILCEEIKMIISITDSTYTRLTARPVLAGIR